MLCTFFLSFSKIKSIVLFRPSTDLCKVCFIKYRLIVKLETLSEDIVPIVKNLYKCIYNNTGIHNIHLNVLSQFSEQLSFQYRQAHKDFQKVISSQAKNMTYRKYKDDFEAFGYVKVLLPFASHYLYLGISQ